MRKAGRRGWVRGGVACAFLVFSCKSAPPSRAPAPAANAVAERPRPPRGPPPPFRAQPGAVLGEVNGIAVLALAAPQFGALSREQRLVAYWAAQALAAGDPLAAEQGSPRNLEVIRLLRGILGRPQVVPALVLARIRSFARAVWLNHGLHDAATGRKLSPPFS